MKRLNVVPGWLHPLIPGLVLASAGGFWIGVTLVAVILGGSITLVASIAVLAAVAGWLAARTVGRHGYFLVWIVCSIVFVCAAEGMIRWSLFGPDALLNPTRYSPAGAMDDEAYLRASSAPAVVYTLRPGFDGWVKGVRVSADSLGFREMGTALDARAEIRIATFGTSVTMGEGVPADAAYPAALQEMLLDLGIAAEVRNFALGGHSLAASIGVLQQFAPAYSPDVVVLEMAVTALNETAAAQTMLSEAFGRRQEAADLSAFERYSFAVTAIYPPASARARVRGLLGSNPPVEAAPADSSYVPHLIDQFGAWAARHRAVGVVFVPRPMIAFGQPDLHLVQREEIRRMANRAGVVYVDSYDAFSPLDIADRMIIFPGDLHPNRAAHRRHAEAVMGALIDTVGVIVTDEMRANVASE